MSVITVKLPKGFMNASITTSNYFIADTNDSSNWDTLSISLPKGNWRIWSQKENIIILHDK